MHSVPPLLPLTMAEPMSREDSLSPPLKILFVPLASPGHIIPMIDIGKLFAARGADCTVILTPLNASRFQSTITRLASLGHRIKLYVLPFPSPSSSSLPIYCESIDTFPSRSLSEPFARSLDFLQVHFDRMVRSNPPDAIVSDLLLPWTASAAHELHIPHYVFPGTGCFALSVEFSLLFNRPQIGSSSSSSDRFIVPGLPNPVYLTKAKLTEATLPGEKTTEFFDLASEADADLSPAGVVVNSFPDLEPGYAEHYERVTGKRVWLLGPVSLCNRDPSDVAERGRGVVSAEVGRIFSWLDSKPAGSVLYACFGSLCRFPPVQLKEIGFGLEESHVPFLWVIREGEEGSRESWLEEMEERVKGRGLVVKGWAPQVGILSHVAVGGFMTHCGWGSAAEAAAAGVPVLTWPLFAEQFYNEELLVGVVGVGEKVGAQMGFVWGEEEKAGVVVGRKKIKERVTWLMTGEGGEEVRRRAREMGEKARRAVEEGGSSYESIGTLMEDMRRRRIWRRRTAEGSIDGGGGSELLE